MSEDQRKYPRPAVTVDLVVFTIQDERLQVKVLKTLHIASLKKKPGLPVVRSI